MKLTEATYLADKLHHLSMYGHVRIEREFAGWWWVYCTRLREGYKETEVSERRELFVANLSLENAVRDLIVAARHEFGER